MNLHESLGSLALGAKSRTFVMVFLGGLLVVDFAMLIVAIIDAERFGSWMEASVYLMGILIPITLIALIFVIAETADEAARIKTYNFMTRSLPIALRSINEVDPAFSGFDDVKRTGIVSPIDVEVAQYFGSCIGRYRVKYQAIDLLLFRLELNVRKANLVLSLPREVVCKNRKDASMPCIADVRELLLHTLKGSQEEGYQLNDVIVDRGAFVDVVLIVKLRENFMITPHERLYFAQDLMFFLKSVVVELGLVEFIQRAKNPAIPAHADAL